MTSTVGFIGLGTMGWPMAANIARAGHLVVGLDTDAARAQAWASEHGGTAADGPEAFADVPVVVTMLPNGKVVRNAVLDGGVADALPDGAVVVDMSSSEPWETLSLAPELAERGVTLLDAPVSGALTRAIDATLTIMLGGEDEAAIARATPVIETMSERIFRTGPLGSGHAMKGLNNFITGTGFVATCEALVVGAKVGLDPAVMLDVMNASSGVTSRRSSSGRRRSSRGASRRASRSRCSPRTSASPTTSPASSTSRRRPRHGRRTPAGRARAARADRRHDDGAHVWEAAGVTVATERE